MPQLAGATTIRLQHAAVLILGQIGGRPGLLLGIKCQFVGARQWRLIVHGLHVDGGGLVFVATVVLNQYSRGQRGGQRKATTHQ